MRFFLVIFLFFNVYTFLVAQELIEYDYELDAYYSNISAFIDLEQDREITDGTDYSETKIYKDLFLNTLSPNIFLVEAAIHPMPLLGLYFRNRHKSSYSKAELFNSNLIQAVTAGFEEPYSLSFFLGRMMIFSKKEEERVGKNRAYMGYLLSIGEYSIKDNLAYEDNWVNLEFKLKGTREKANSDLDWSFRIGGRFHSNPDFTDTILIGARRSSIDYKKSAYSLINNSAYSAMLSVDAKTFELTEAEMMIEKKFPIGKKKMSFGLGLGYLYYSSSKYGGELKGDGIINHQLLLRPNFKW